MGVVTLGGWSLGLAFAVVFSMLVDFGKIIVELIGRSEPRAFRSEPEQVTAVVASRNGADELPATLASLGQQLSADRILVVDDASTDGTGDAARSRGVNVHRFKNSKGKASAINYAVHRVSTPLTLLLDDDTRLGTTRIPTSLITDEGFDAVAFHVLPDRRDRDGAKGGNFLGSLQRYEYGKSMAIGRRFHDVTESVSCVSGAVGLFRTADLDRFHHEHTCVFPGEDLQRTMIHLLNERKIVFADEPVWTVAPSTVGGWVRQRLFGWYPGTYHQIANFIRLLFRPRVAWRLRYEVLYNLYTVVSDPIKVLSIVMIAVTPGIRHWIVAMYLAYLSFEVYPWLMVTVPGERRRASLGVLLFYPIYGAINTVLRALAVVSWFWMRYVTGTMRPRRGPKDRLL